MLRIIIPAAGEGGRFKEAGYKKPKHLISVLGKPMITRVIETIRPKSPFSLEVITQESLGHKTGGAVETILEGEIDANPLLIANCDQLVKLDVDKFISTSLDGMIATFKSQSPHHSYVKTRNNIINKIKEKEVISTHAVSGVYYFKNGLDFKHAAKIVMAKGIKHNNEFYVSSVLDEMIKEGFKLGIKDCPTSILGTPEDLQRFEVAHEF